MQIPILYLSTAVVFLIVDALMLNLVMAPLFRSQIPDMMRDSPAIGAAATFYLAYVAGLIYLISYPALVDDAPDRALLHAAILGAMAYGTYEFTSFAVLKGWSWQMVAADVTWGAVLTGGSAWAGVVITRALTATGS